MLVLATYVVLNIQQESTTRGENDCFFNNMQRIARPMCCIHWCYISQLFLTRHLLDSRYLSFGSISTNQCPHGPAAKVHFFLTHHFSNLENNVFIFFKIHLEETSHNDSRTFTAIIIPNMNLWFITQVKPERHKER